MGIQEVPLLHAPGGRRTGLADEMGRRLAVLMLDARQPYLSRPQRDFQPCDNYIALPFATISRSHSFIDAPANMTRFRGVLQRHRGCGRGCCCTAAYKCIMTLRVTPEVAGFIS